MQAKRREQQKARLLRRQGKSLNEIVQLLKVSKSSVSVWVRGVILTKDQKNKLREKEVNGGEKGRSKLVKKWQKYRELYPKPQGPRWPTRSVEKFFDTWTPEMAYVLGYFAADGSIYKNKRGSCRIEEYQSRHSTGSIRTLTIFFSYVISLRCGAFFVSGSVSELQQE